jgi:hypothetical protein
MQKTVKPTTEELEVGAKDSLPSAIKVVEMNFRAVYQKALDEDKSLMAFLKRHGLLKDNYGYSAFNPEIYERVVSSGQYRHTTNGVCESEVFCCRTGKAPWGDRYIADHGADTSVLKYCEQNTPQNAEAAMIAIYDLDRMENIWGSEFKFRPEALVGIIKLKGFLG